MQFSNMPYRVDDNRVHMRKESLRNLFRRIVREQVFLHVPLLLGIENRIAT
jgi:hypothetical protein